MPDNFVDLTVTSPPYDGLRTYNGYSFPFEEIAQELYRVTKQGGVLVWVVSDATTNGTESGTSFRQALYFKECGFNLHDTMIYHKHSPPLTHNRYEQHFEYMFILSKGKPKTFNPILEKKIWEDNRTQKAIRREKDGSSDIGYAGKSENKIKGNVWKYNVSGGHVTDDKIAYKHPAIFPEQLCADQRPTRHGGPMRRAPRPNPPDEQVQPQRPPHHRQRRNGCSARQSHYMRQSRTTHPRHSHLCSGPAQSPE